MHEYSSARDFRLIGIAKRISLLFSIFSGKFQCHRDLQSPLYPLAFHTALETATIVFIRFPYLSSAGMHSAKDAIVVI